MGLIISLLVNAAAVFIVGYLLPGITIDNFWTAILVAIVLGLLNTFIKPILNLISLPITVVTLGLFTVIIDAFLILVTSWIITSFQVQNFLWAIIFAILLSIVSSLLHMFIKK